MMKAPTFGSIVIVALLAALGMPGRLRAQMGGRAPAGSAVKAEIFADTTAITPGKAFTLAIVLTTQPGWHIYWQNPGESGLPTTFQFTVPSDCKAELMTFPLPHTFVQPGGITGYGYTGRTVFLARVMTPEVFKPGETLPAAFAVNVSWLCCDKDQCVPGGAKLSLDLALGAGKEANAELFAAGRAGLPLAEPPAGLAKLSALTAGEDDQYTMQIGWTEPVRAVEAFPDAMDGLVFDVKGTTTRSAAVGATSVVDIRAHIMAGQKLKVEKLPLWVAYTGGDGVRKGFVTQVDLHALGARASR